MTQTNFHTLAHFLPSSVCLPLTLPSLHLSLSRYSHADSVGLRGSHDHAAGPGGGAEWPRVPALPLAPSACAWAQRVKRRAAPRGALPRPVCGSVVGDLWCSLAPHGALTEWNGIYCERILNVRLCGKLCVGVPEMCVVFTHLCVNVEGLKICFPVDWRHF